jgi:hypothetical protein
MTTKPKLELGRPHGALNVIKPLLTLPTKLRCSARYRPPAR